MPPSLVITVHSVVATICTPEDDDNWLDKFDMERHQIHCSGRTKASDLHIVKGSTADALSDAYRVS